MNRISLIKLTSNFKIRLRIIGVFLMIFGACSFLSGVILSSDKFDYKGEVPLSDVQDIIIDQDGFIYLSSQFYSKILCYNQLGEFVNSWNVKAGNGVFKMLKTKSQNIQVVTARGNKRLLFSRSGVLIHQEILPDYVYNITERAGETVNYNNYDFWIDNSTWNTKIIRSNELSPDKVIINQSILYFILKAPLPAILFIAIGVIVNISLMAVRE
ncbi:hypothetical protein [Flammeovirga aprica]|uniref:Uncharacterized protein n=1 Tax=Flammeovirga aprica JL-4 TaxID=694437 RepID=A0A7X9P1Z3_9BACT|nr:hypothetical protein [Flammeovirga aprica]NME68079.1 hypothetical protein [Flammeovirga aprica JL-4]